MPSTPNPGLTWPQIAASVYRAYHTVVAGRSHQNVPLPPFEQLPPERQAAWEAAARQARRCILVTDPAGPVPSEELWAAWHADWEGKQVSPPADAAEPARKGVVRETLIHALTAAVLLAITLAASTFGHTPAQEPAMPAPLHDHFQTAFDATAAREHGRAAASWAAARAAGGNDVECLLGQADAAFHARDLASAEMCAREVIKLVPRHAQAHFWLGAVMEARGDRVVAAKWYTLAGRYGDHRAARRLAEVSR